MLEDILWQEYLDKIKPYFKYCSNYDTLEIGPFNGWHSELIDSHSPKSLTFSGTI